MGLFSVSMICHGRLEDLRKALTAVSIYQPPGNEVLLIDNNSPQSLAAVASDFSGEVAIDLVVRRQLPSSLAFASARNIALRLARNPWIVSLDPDCVIDETYFEGAAHAISQFGVDDRLILAGERHFITSADATIEDIRTNPQALRRRRRIRSASNHFLPRDKRMPEMERLPDIEHPWDYMHGCNLVYSAYAARACGGHDESFDGAFGYEDIEFAYRMITNLECSSRYVADMGVYHLEPTRDSSQPDRSQRGANKNWNEVGVRIPGYHEFKLAQYAKLKIFPSGLKLD